MKYDSTYAVAYVKPWSKLSSSVPAG